MKNNVTRWNMWQFRQNPNFGVKEKLCAEISIRNSPSFANTKFFLHSELFVSYNLADLTTDSNWIRNVSRARSDFSRSPYK